MNATANQPPPRPELFSKLGCFEADIASDDDLEELKSQICASLHWLVATNEPCSPDLRLRAREQSQESEG